MAQSDLEGWQLVGLFGAFLTIVLGVMVYGLKTGRLPARGGGLIDRRRNPKLFVYAMCCFGFVAACFLVPVVIGFKRVLSR